MRWEGKAKHDKLTPAHTWSKRDEGNFGGRSLLTDQNELIHEGVPGMRWGVITKKYVKKGYNTIARRRAILKQKRKAEAKAQFEEGYHRGQRVASNSYFIKNKVSTVLDRKKREQEGSLSDRAVSKATDFALKKSGVDKQLKKYGLDVYIPRAKDFLKQMKDQGLDKIYEDLQTEKGQARLQKYVNFMARGVSKSIGAGQIAARLAGKGGRIARKAIGAGIRSAAKASGSTVKSGYKWLREGNPSGARRIHDKVNAFEKTLSKYGNTAANMISKGSQKTHQGAKYAQRQLDRLLTKRPRRRA